MAHSEKRGLLHGLLMIVALVLVFGTRTMLGQEQSSTPEQVVDPLATQITLEDVLETGHVADLDVLSQVTVQRPNKLRSRRRGDLVDQDFFYDGKTLTLSNLANSVYATVPAPASIEGMLDYVRETLDLIVPVSDLVYRNAFPLLMKDVTSAVRVGKAIIGGVKCDHILFVRPGVDFQVWVAESGPPLPHKYVVTDTGTSERLRNTTILSHWEVNPAVTGDTFVFVPPAGAEKITFVPLLTSSSSTP